MVERKTLNLVVVGSIPTEGAFCSALLSPSFCVAGDAVAAASSVEAALAQLGERQTEDLKVPGSIPGGGTFDTSLARLVLWCNWLALRTLNPAIRVQIPVGPFVSAPVA